jgi:hypothetical protein
LTVYNLKSICGTPSNRTSISSAFGKNATNTHHLSTVHSRTELDGVTVEQGAHCMRNKKEELGVVVKPVILALKKQRQKDRELEAGLGYIVKPDSKKGRRDRVQGSR